MNKDEIPNQLNAEYYRRKNWGATSTTTTTTTTMGGGGSATTAPAATTTGVVGDVANTTAMSTSSPHRPIPPPPSRPTTTAVSAVPSHGGRFGGGGGPVHRLASSRTGRLLMGSARYGGYALGLFASANAAYHVYQSRLVDDFFGGMATYDRDGDEDNDDDDYVASYPSSSYLDGGRLGAMRSSRRRRRRRRVLILPFEDLRVVERRRGGGGGGGGEYVDVFRRLLSSDPYAPRTMDVEVGDVVRALHAAASDDNVVAVRANFGEGNGPNVGTAHAEEIRDAMRVFNESHRVHLEPNVVGRREPSSLVVAASGGEEDATTDKNIRTTTRRRRKYSHAYGQSYDWGSYFLASGCSYVHLQARGYLNLHGSVASNVFVGGLLDKYGIRAHVFRHGEYKNAPSVLTDSKYSNAYLETVKSLTSSVDDVIRRSIEVSRSNKRMMNAYFDDVMWKSIIDYGGLTSSNSIEIGLVDTAPPVDPMPYLLDVNNASERMGAREKGKKNDDADDARTKFEETFGIHDSYRKFNATESISLMRYLDMLNRRDKVEHTRGKINDVLRWLSGTSTATSMILSALGLRPDDDASPSLSSSSSGSKKCCDRIAVLTVDGNIDRSCASRVIRSLREIRKDKRVKAVVLRVDSPGGSVVSSEAILEEVKRLNKPVICSMSNAAASGGYYISMSSKKIFANSTTYTGSIGVFGIKFDASEFAKSYGVTGDHYPRGNHAAAMHPLTPLTPVTKKNIERTVLDYYDYFKAVVAAGRSLSMDDVEEVSRGRVWTGEQAREVGLVDALGGLDRAVSYTKRAYATTERVEVDHFPRKFSLLQLLSGLESSSSYADVCRASLAVMLGLGDGDNERGSLIKLLCDLSELKFAKKPHFMLTMDEETAIDIITKGD